MSGLPFANASVQDILKAYPAPWVTKMITEAGHPLGGLIAVFDAANKEVSLFAMMRFLELVTERMSVNQSKEPS